MKSIKSKWFCLLFLLPITPSYAALGNHSSEYYEIAGILVGIFFIWSLIKIVKNGNETDESEIEENSIDLLDHFIENNPFQDN